MKTMYELAENLVTEVLNGSIFDGKLVDNKEYVTFKINEMLSLNYPVFRTEDKITLYMSLKDAGDGSVYSTLFSVKELAQWDNEHQDPPFAEECITEIKINGSNIKVEDIVHKCDYFLEMLLEERDEEDIKNFIHEVLHDDVYHYDVYFMKEDKPRKNDLCFYKKDECYEIFYMMNCLDYYSNWDLETKKKKKVSEKGRLKLEQHINRFEW